MNEIIDKRVYKSLIISFSLTILLFIFSLVFNGYYINDGEDSVGSLGLIALLFGFFGMNISWLANPCLILSLIHLKRENLQKAFIFSLLSVVFGLSFLFYDEIIANEGGTKSEITGYGLGYWLWLSSLIVNFIGMVIIKEAIKKYR